MKTLKTIARGVALLDEKQPGWERRVNLDTLELSSSCNCVCGQLIKRGTSHNRYQRMLSKLGLAFYEGQKHGFTTHGQQTFEKLTEEWTRVIRAKRRGFEITS